MVSWECDLMVLATAQPMALRPPHTGPGGNLKWTTAGNKLSYLGGDYDHLAATCGLEGLDFKLEQELWALASVLVLLKEMGFEMSPPFSQIAQNLTKISFLLHQHLPHGFGFCGGREPNLFFFFFNSVTQVEIELCVSGLDTGQLRWGDAPWTNHL